MAIKAQIHCLLALASPLAIAIVLTTGFASAEDYGASTVTPVSFADDAVEGDPFVDDDAADDVGDENAVDATSPDVAFGAQTYGYGMPKWAARAAALALFRERPDSALLLFDQTDPAANIDASDFDFGYGPGYELSLMRRFDCWPDIEFRYLGCDAWTGRAELVTMGTVEINTAIPATVTGPREIDAAYGTELGSFELNLRSDLWRDCVVWLVGLRYFELDEAFHANLVPLGPGFPVTYDTDTRNRLYGAQVGAEACLLNLGQWLRLDFVGKAGIGSNTNAQNTLLDNTVVPVSAVGNADGTSFFGEAHLAAVVCLYGNLSLRASYGAMGISDVALATDQLSVADFIGTNAVHDNGNAFYHGGFVGLQCGY
jgi:hypothetical protein